MYSRSRIIGEDLYGPGPTDLRLAERIGDFVLIMEPGWTIKDFLPGEGRPYLKANHAGLTDREMLLPLVKLG
jgi:hypothetical protein